MSVIGSNILAGASGAGAAGGYTIDQSLRFEDGSSAYLSRTPASAGNRKTWTWSGWVKRGKLGTEQMIFEGGTYSGGSTEQLRLFFTSGDALEFNEFSSSAYRFRYVTTQLFRDPGSWYHIIAVLDTVNSIGKLYVNGSQITTFSTSTAPTLNFEGKVNLTVVHSIGRREGIGSYLDGYMAEVHFIDGQALTPDSFGEVDDTYGHWKPIEYTGTYGTNGFYLPFSGTFYNDASGNGNNWTANNLATTDVVLDSPTNNFCTLNPVYTYGANVTLSEGNLGIADKNSNWSSVFATMTKPSGKIYVESCHIANAAGAFFGIATDSNVSGTGFSDGNYIGKYSNDFGFRINDYGSGSSDNEGYSTNASFTSLGTAQPAVGNVYQLAVDFDNGKVYWGKNNTWYNSANPSAGTGGISISTSDLYHVGMTAQGTVLQQILNFGQDSSFAGQLTAQNNTDDNGYGDFYYSPPSGFLALCTANLSDPAVVPGENFNTVLYTGNGTSQSISTGFNPDLVWMKPRDQARNHRLVDDLRGNAVLSSNTTDAEAAGGDLVLTSTGFNLTSGSSNYNGSGYTYVAWNWKANNTSGSSNTDGSITSTVAANVDAGFSIVSYTGNSTDNSTVGHGLSSAPDFIITKARDGAGYDWHINSSDLGFGSKVLYFTTAAATTASNSVKSVSASTMTLGNSIGVNYTGKSYIAYCFHSVDGYSKFGSYTGNGSDDGPFIFTGFRPAFVMIKNASSVYNWHIYDVKRETYNTMGQLLLPNSSSAEIDSSSIIDVVSNGFKVKVLNQSINESGSTLIYMAFAEYPFKYTTAR